MTYLSTLESDEKKIRASFNNKAWAAITLAVLSCALMIGSSYLISLFIQPIAELSKSIASAFASDEETVRDVAYQIALAIYYSLSIIIPFGVSYLLFAAFFGRDPEPYAVKHGAPKMPFFYIAGTIGVCYLFNFVINLFFGELFDNYFPIEEEPVPACTAAVIIYFIHLAVLPAILEEWAFRGIILKRLLPYDRRGAIILSALLFGLMHVRPPQVLFATLFGLILGYCYDYTRSIKFTALIHFVNNLISGAVTLLSDNESALASIGTVFLFLMIVGVGAVIFYTVAGVAKHRISFIRPPVIGAKVTTSRFFAMAFANIGTPLLVALLIYEFYVRYIAS